MTSAVLPGGQLVPGAPDRVVGSQTGVGQRSSVHRVESRRQWHDMARVRDQEVLGHSAIQSQPSAAARDRCGREVLAVRLDADAAPLAGATAPRTVHSHGLPHGRAGDALAPAVHPTGVRVSEGERGSPGQDTALEVVHEMQVGVAGAGATDPDHDLPRTGRRLRHLNQARFGLPIE